MASKQEQAAHLAMTTPAARKLELSLGLPMELTVGKIALETGWGTHAPGNNYAGIKCKSSDPNGVLRETFEDLTAVELADFIRRGGKIKRHQNSPNGKTRIWIDGWFLSFATPAEFFDYYGNLIVNGTHFKARFARYKASRNLDQLMADLSGADGKPKYFTGDGYLKSWSSIVRQQNVQTAIAQARAATKTTQQETNMSKFISSNPGDNALLVDAEGLVRQRALVGLPSFGIFANAEGAQAIVPQADFDANKIDGSSPACLLIKIVDRPDRDDSSAVPSFDDYINVGKTLAALESAPDLTAGVIAMIQKETNKIGAVFVPGEAERRIANVPAVAFAARAAFEAAWDAAGGKAKPQSDEPPPVDPGGGRGGGGD